MLHRCCPECEPLLLLPPASPLTRTQANWAQPQELDELSLTLDSLYSAILGVEVIAPILSATEAIIPPRFSFLRRSQIVPTLLAGGSLLGLAFFHYVVDAVNHHTARSDHTINHSPTIGWGAYAVIVAPLIGQLVQFTLPQKKQEKPINNDIEMEPLQTFF